MSILRVVTLVASAAAQSNLPGVSCGSFGSDLRILVGPPREQARCDALVSSINNFCVGVSGSSVASPTTLACRSDGADPAEYELYFTSASSCATNAAALSGLVKAAYGLSTQTDVTCGANETAVVAGSILSRAVDCTSLAAGIRFLSTSGASSLRSSICQPVPTGSTPTRVEFYFLKDTSFDAMYTASDPPALNSLRQALAITLATAVLQRDPALVLTTARLDVVLVSESGQCIVLVHAPAPGESSNSVIASALEQTVDSKIPFTYNGETATTMPATTTSATLTAQEDNNGNDSSVIAIIVVVIMLVVVFAVVLIIVRRRGPIEKVNVKSMWYARPEKKAAPQRLQYSKLRGGGPTAWIHDIGKYESLDPNELEKLFPSNTGYSSHLYNKIFPLGDGNRSSKDYAVRVANLAMVPSNPSIQQEFKAVASEKRIGGDHYGLAFVDSFHQERAIALLSDVFSWDDVWDTDADIIVTMTGENENCGVHIPGELYAAQHGPVVATRLGALKVSPSVVVSVVSLHHEVTEQTKTVRIFRAVSWQEPPCLSVFVELLIAAKETVRLHGSSESIVFIHDDNRQRGPSAGSLALAWVSLQSALYTGEINLPQTLFTMQSIRPRMIKTYSEYSMVYAGLRHLLTCVPAVKDIASSEVDARMKEVLMEWIAGAEQARAFGEPEPLDGEDDRASEGGYLTMEAVEPQSTANAPSNDGGYLTLQSMGSDTVSLGGSSVALSQSENDYVNGISESMFGSETESQKDDGSDDEVGAHEVGADDVSREFEGFNEAQEDTVTVDEPVPNDPVPPIIPIVALEAEEDEPQDLTMFAKFKSSRERKRKEKKEAKLKAQEEERKQKAAVQKAAEEAAAAQREAEREAEREAKRAEEEAERKRKKMETEEKRKETYGFFEDFASVPEPEVAVLKNTRQQQLAQAKAAKMAEEREKAQREAEEQRRQREREAEAKQRLEKDELELIEAAKEAKAAAVRDAYRNRRRSSMKKFQNSVH